MEEQELHLYKSAGNIIKFIRELSFSFSDIAETRNITLAFDSPAEQFFTAFDHDKIERIVFNLLSNAFKFTPQGGSVKVSLRLLPGGDDTGREVLQMKVTDTGIGIEKDKQAQIFKRFFQTDIPDTMVNQGSGIGLAITNEFIKLHNGEIFVESEPGKGSAFTVLIPFLPCDEKAVQTEGPETQTAGVLQQETLTLPAQSKNELKKTILLVEDNDDFRFYLKDNLKNFYNIAEAENGKAGWQKTLAAHPHLVVCDISMPEMNGIDLCKKIKGDKRTSFIPVILLTALAGDEQQLSGLETGASDYITKPFNFEILLSKIKNQLVQQESFKRTYQKQVQVNSSEVIMESADDKFIQNALAVVEKNISDPDFSVEEMSRLLLLSRVGAYKKLFALTGKTPLEFIRSVRLQRAAQLLEKNELTVAEVAYEVGFNNPKNFAKYFKAEYNLLPSAFATSKKTGVESKESNKKE
jgi:DNA-binding response OmpR family regulator